MSDHIGLRIGDYLQDRLTAEERRAVEQHLEGCRECAEEVAFAVRFREAGLDQGLVHIRPDRIVALAVAGETPSEAESRHLRTCRACGEEIEWAGQNSDAAAEDLNSTTTVPLPPRGRFRLPRWIPAVAGLAALAALALVFLPRMGKQETGFADLIVVEPLPVRIQRSAAAPDSFAVSRLRGLEAYRDGKFREAGEHFRRALELVPEDPELRLYAGSVLLLEGRAAEAAIHLEAGLGSASSEPLREELAWHLAAAQLDLGDVDGARRALAAVAALGRSHATEARRILETLP